MKLPAATRPPPSSASSDTSRCSRRRTIGLASNPPDGDRGEQQTDVLSPVAVVGGDDRHDLLERADEHEERQRRLEERSQQQRPPHDDGTRRQAAVLDALACPHDARPDRQERQEHAEEGHRRDTECRSDAEPCDQRTTNRRTAQAGEVEHGRRVGHRLLAERRRYEVHRQLGQHGALEAGWYGVAEHQQVDLEHCDLAVERQDGKERRGDDLDAGEDHCQASSLDAVGEPATERGEHEARPFRDRRKQPDLHRRPGQAVDEIAGRDHLHPAA